MTDVKDPTGIARPAHVLVVDDEERNRELLGDVLASQDCRVTMAEDGQAALDSIKADAPDVVLLDVMMPKMDGFEVCRRLKGDPGPPRFPC
jgi:two-component system cell cycle response regulator